MSKNLNKNSYFRHICTKNVSENQIFGELNGCQVSEIHTSLYLRPLLYLDMFWQGRSSKTDGDIDGEKPNSEEDKCSVNDRF